MTNSPTITAHYVLAGAYRGKDVGARSLLVHASADGSATALCRKVKADALCDQVEEVAVDCPGCLAKLAKLGLNAFGIAS